MYYSSDFVEFTCGLGWVGNFSFEQNYYEDLSDMLQGKFYPGGGTPFFVAGFINEEKCKKAYELLESHAVISFQSPVMKNKNSGNDFFFCVFSTEPEHEQVKFSWPFKE